LGLLTALSLVALVSALMVFRQFPSDDLVDISFKGSLLAAAGVDVVFVLLVWIGMAAGIS
jgi:hypothetical protein